MEKSKLGISVALLGAALYFLGLVNSLAVVIAAGYVLLCEEDTWLRKNAVKAVAVIVVFALAFCVTGALDNILAFFNGIIGWFPTHFRLGYPLNLDVLYNNALSLAKMVILILLGVSALKHHSNTVETPDPLDQLVDKNV